MENQTSLLTKIISIFWEPSKTFKAISEKVTAVDIIIPLLLVTIVSWVTIPYVTPIAISEQKSKVEQSDRFNEEQKEAMLEGIEGGNKAIGYIATPVTIIILSVLLALVLWFVGNFLLGGDRKFMEMWAVAAFAGLIDMVASIIKVPLMVQKGTLNIYTSLAIFMEESGSFLFRFMKNIDVFSLWKIIILAIGLSVLYKKKLTTPLTILIALWLIYCLGAAAFAGLNPLG
ncbi:MAG: YIP1 family protein [Fidelibacterota bacterium]